MSPRHHATRVRQLVRDGATWEEALDTVPEEYRELVKAHLRSIRARRAKK